MEKVVCLISGGIDSPVAAHIMKKKGYGMIFLYCENLRDANEASLEKIRKITKKIDRKAELYVAHHGEAMADVVNRCEPQLRCLLCKRMMYRSAERLAKLVGAKAIVTGENIGQVASQTLANLAVLDSATKLPVLRPLLTMEKNETVALARRIGTYELSIKDAPQCRFVPQHPETQAVAAEVEDEESVIEAVELSRKTGLEKIR